MIDGAEQVGTDTRIVIDGEEVAYLLNIQPSQLDASDFVV